MSIRFLTNELQKKAENELNEVPSRVKEDLKHIKQWIKTQPHLNVKMDDQWLISFLRGCKSILQRTKQKIDNFYKTRTLLPEFFVNRDPFSSEIQDFLNAGALFPLPATKGIDGPRIFMIRFHNCDPARMTIVNLLKIYLMSLEILMQEDDNCVVSGICVWMDLKDFNLRYILQCTISFLRKSILCMESIYPVRMKGIFCTNAPSAFEVVFNLVKLLMCQKLKNRMHLYSAHNFESVYDSIPKTAMPKEFGGNGESADVLAAQWKEKIESYKDWFLGGEKHADHE